MNSVNLDNFADPFFLGETKEELRRIVRIFTFIPKSACKRRELPASLLIY